MRLSAVELLHVLQDQAATRERVHESQRSYEAGDYLELLKALTAWVEELEESP